MEKNAKNTKGPFGWRSGKVGGWKIVGGWKSGKMENIQFSFLCVWLEGWKSERVENSFVWLERKMEG